MAPKSKSKGIGRLSKTPGQTSASNPNRTATSPTGDATTTSILSSSAPQIITTQPLPSPSPLPVQETQQELIYLNLECLPSPWTSPTASTLWPMKDVFTNLFAPALACAMTALQTGMKDDPKSEMVVAALFGSQLDEMESTLRSLLWLVEIMNRNPEEMVAFEPFFKMEGLRSAIRLTEELLAKRKKRHGSGGSCGGSKGGGGIPDGGSGDGDGDGEGGGVSA